MKKVIVIIVGLLLILATAYAGLYKSTFSKKRVYVTLSARNDTSAAVNLYDWENIELTTGVYGTDSIKMLMRIEALYSDGYSGEQWRAVAYDTIWYGKSGDVAIHPYGHGLILRGYGTNLIPGIYWIRVINTVTGYGSGDSISTKLASYTQGIVGR